MAEHCEHSDERRQALIHSNRTINSKIKVEQNASTRWLGQPPYASTTRISVKASTRHKHFRASRLSANVFQR